ncbi:MAG: GIY-YIG nuclease family protein [Formosimonas sp.]|jgi:putative endonuclease
MKQPAVYIMCNAPRGTLYIGVTSDLVQRAYQHRESLVDGFTKKYGLKVLVWYELHDTMVGAIAREKSMNKWRRNWKIELIEKENSDWRDLWRDVVGM